MDEWEAWDVVERGLGQMRLGLCGFVGFDLTALFEIGRALGYPLRPLAEFLPLIEAGKAAACASDAP